MQLWPSTIVELRLNKPISGGLGGPTTDRVCSKCPPCTGDPAIYFSPWNFRVHGIHWSAVEHEPSFPEVWARIAPLAAAAPYFVAHNAEFDAAVLGACFSRHGMPALCPPFVCSLHTSTVMWPLESYRLSRVCQFLKIALTHHDAQSDAAAAATVMLRAIRSGYVLGNVTPAPNWAQKHLSASIVDLIRDIMADGVVEREEVLGFDAWLTANPHALAV
jgi:DNA polymerase III epsilon subunit-like protein